MKDRSPHNLKRPERELISPFPSFVAFAAQSEARLDYLLPPEEAALLNPQAVAKRQLEFRLGRAAANKALSTLLKASPDPVLQGIRGEPLWPRGVVGAISHSHRLAVAAVAWQTDCAGIGLDIEGPSRADLKKMAAKLFLPEELAWAGAAPLEIDSRLKLLFSAKESAYKAFAGREQGALDFRDLLLLPGHEPRRLMGRLQRAIPPYFDTGFEFEIGFADCSPYLFTHVYLAPHGN